MRTLADSDRNTLPRGWVRQAVMGVLRWKELPPGRAETIHRAATLQVHIYISFFRFVVVTSSCFFFLFFLTY